MKSLSRASVLGIVVMMAMLLGLDVQAQATAPPSGALAVSLPSSTAPATGFWRVMHPSTFSGTVASAIEQCQHDAELSSVDQLTPEKCVLAEQLLSSNQYVTVLVPDGIRHDYMNGRTNGRSFVSRNVEKQTGRMDRAIVLDLGDGIFMYWYTGVRGQSCNNVGFTFVVTPPLPPAAPLPPAPPPQPRCRVVEVRQQAAGPSYTYLSGFVIPAWCPPGAVLPGLFLQSGGQSDPSISYITVCDPE